MIDIAQNISFKTIDTEPIRQFCSDYGVAIRMGTYNYGAVTQGEIIGILTILDYGNLYMIIGFYVLPLFRSLGIGSRLLEMIQNLKLNHRLIVKYESVDVDVDRFNSFLRKNNWKSINYDYTTYELNWRSMTEEDIRSKEFYDQDIIAEFDCRTLSEMSHEEIICAENQSIKLVDRHLLPFGTSNIISQLSTFAYNRDSLVGWLVVLKQDQNAYIKSVFVKEQYRITNLGLYLMLLTIGKLVHGNTDVNVENLTFSFDKNNKRLHRFYRNMSAGHIVKEWDSFIASITL